MNTTINRSYYLDIKMKKLFYTFLIVCCSNLLINAQEFRSPDGNLTMNFSVKNNGIPTYRLTFKGKDVIKLSKLGLELKDEAAPVKFGTEMGMKSKSDNGKTSLYDNFVVMDNITATFDETWITNRFNLLPLYPGTFASLALSLLFPCS